MKRPPLSTTHRHRRRAEQAYRTRVKRGLRELYADADRALANAKAELAGWQERLVAAHAEIPEEIIPPGPLYLRVGILVKMLVEASSIIRAQERALKNAAAISKRIVG